MNQKQKSMRKSNRIQERPNLSIVLTEEREVRLSAKLNEGFTLVIDDNDDMDLTLDDLETLHELTGLMLEKIKPSESK